MRRLILITALVCTLVPGCAVKESTPPAPSKSDGASLGGHIKRGMEKPKVQNVLQELGQFYLLYNTENGRSPASWAELKAYMQKDSAKLVQIIEEGRYEIIWGARPGSGVVVAYEKDPDLRGNQVAVMGDGHVESMSAAKLQAALQNK